MDQAEQFPRPIVSQVIPYRAFYAAEAYHQNYSTLHPDNPYIARYVLPKVAHLLQQYPALYRDK